MFASWFNLTMLAAESQRVIGLRLVTLAWGGKTASDEAELMVSEKMSAAWNAAGRLLVGDTPLSVVETYRETVQANTQRLLAAA